jgi:hypothetical protein
LGFLGGPFLAEGLDAVVDEVADIADGGVHGLGDLLVVEAGDELQFDGFALAVGELVDEVVEGGGGFGVFEVLGGRGRGVRGGFEFEGGGVHGDEAVVFAVVVDGLVFADGEEPGGDAVGVERGEGGGEFDEGVLDDVAGVFEVGGEGEGVADERALEAVQQGFEGRGRGAHAGQVQGASRVGRDFYWGAMKKIGENTE